MLRFLRFKASLNLNNGKKSGLEYSDTAPGIALNGAYRTNKDELFGSDLYTESLNKIEENTQQAKVPTKKSLQSNKQSKSTSDLTKPSNKAVNVRKSVPDISQIANNNQPPKINVKEQKKLEKQRLAEQKKQEKLADKERQRAEKLRKETEKQKVVKQTSAAQSQPKQVEEKKTKNEEQKKLKKRTAPQPQQQGIASQVQQQRTEQPTIKHQAKRQAPKTPSASRQKQQYPTNTLESSISKSSGPPPYSSVPEVKPNMNDGSGNTSFANPVEDMDSWGLISQHRQQMNRQAGVSKSATKQKHLDLNYNVGNTRSQETRTN